MLEQPIQLKQIHNASIRDAKAHELWQLIKIQKKSFGLVTMPLIQTFFEHLLHIVHFRVVAIDQRIVGYIGIQQLSKEQSRINILAVHPDAQHMGVGRQLMRSVHTTPLTPETNNVILNVRVSNHNAFNLYQSMDYQIDHRQTGYYSRPKEDGYFMKKDL